MTLDLRRSRLLFHHLARGRALAGLPFDLVALANVLGHFSFLTMNCACGERLGDIKVPNPARRETAAKKAADDGKVAVDTRNYQLVFSGDGGQGGRSRQLISQTQSVSYHVVFKRSFPAIKLVHMPSRLIP